MPLDVRSKRRYRCPDLATRLPIGTAADAQAIESCHQLLQCKRLHRYCAERSVGMQNTELTPVEKLGILWSSPGMQGALRKTPDVRRNVPGRIAARTTQPPMRRWMSLAAASPTGQPRPTQRCPSRSLSAKLIQSTSIRARSQKLSASWHPGRCSLAPRHPRRISNDQPIRHGNPGFLSDQSNH